MRLMQMCPVSELVEALQVTMKESTVVDQAEVSACIAALSQHLTEGVARSIMPLLEKNINACEFITKSLVILPEINVDYLIQHAISLEFTEANSMDLHINTMIEHGYEIRSVEQRKRPYPFSLSNDMAADTDNAEISKNTGGSRQPEVVPVQELMDKILDPVSFFTDTTMIPSIRDPIYEMWVIAYLCNLPPYLDGSYIKKLVSQCKGGSLYLSLHLLKEKLSLQWSCAGKCSHDICRAHKRATSCRRPRRVAGHSYPAIPSKRFFYELSFIENEDQVRDKVGERISERERLKHTLPNVLVECPICVRDDFIADEMFSCTACCKCCCIECMQKHLIVQLSEFRSVLYCPFESCDQPLMASSFKGTQIDPDIMSKVYSLLRRYELSQSHIDGLVDCPECDFSMIVDNPDEKYFQCLNPMCMALTCITCKEADHRPYSCDEYKDRRNVNIVQFIESRMSEAIIRRCPSCNTRFVKQGGCDMVTCARCGTTACYLCGKSPCSCHPGNSNWEGHYEEMKTAYDIALREFKHKIPLQHSSAADQIVIPKFKDMVEGFNIDSSGENNESDDDY